MSKLKAYPSSSWKLSSKINLTWWNSWFMLLRIIQIFTDELVLMAVLEPLQTEFAIHHRLASWVIILWFTPSGGGARAQADRRLPYGGPSGFGPSLRSHPFISRCQDSQHRLLTFRAKKLPRVSIVHNIFILPMIFYKKVSAKSSRLFLPAVCLASGSILSSVHSGPKLHAVLPDCRNIQAGILKKVISS